MVADIGQRRFRREFQQLYRLTVIPKVQVVLLTGTLPSYRIQDLVSNLFLPSLFMFRMRTTRRDIKMSIVYTKDDLQESIKLAENAIQGGGKAIIFTYSIFCAEKLANLSSYECYHSDLDEVKRSTVLNNFRSGRKRVVIATSSLGAGLDVKDIRAVIHCGTAHQLTDFVQEAGRAVWI